MIRKKDIDDKAKELNISSETIEKDYVLGHFINSFYSFKENRNLFILKGGTSLRKCYFPDYRFSEDLDFTIMDNKFRLTSKFLKKMAEKCTIDSGILFADVIEKTKTIHDTNFHVNEYAIPFWGANHQKKDFPTIQKEWPTRIKLDFSYNELIITPIEYRRVNHSYDDMLVKYPVPVYSLKEIFTEKIRSFEQRNHISARDYYDVWYLLQNIEFENWDEIRSLLNNKCLNKKVAVNPNIFEDKNRKDLISSYWVSSLDKQLKDLPDFETVWLYLKNNLFQKLKFL